jgi:hypothetical protein
MSFQHHGADAICFAPCHYADLSTAFRGPERDLSGDYIACVGGAGMFGKFVDWSLPDLIEQSLGVPAANLGQVNGGLDFMSTPGMIALARGASATVVDLVGAHNLSNRFYAVHPRRNDRVVRCSRLLQQAFPDLDLSDVHFTRHLLTLMQATAPDRAETVIEDLRCAWMERMHRLLAMLPGPVILLWLGGGPIPQRAEDPAGPIPFVDTVMVDQVAQGADDLIVIDAPELRSDLSGMSVPDTARSQLSLLPTSREVAFASERVVHSLARLRPEWLRQTRMVQGR